jgi:glutamate racemase
VADERPIGVFDSGLGGLTVVRAIMDDLPHEEIRYLGDTGRFPYGPRPAEEIRGFAVEIARHLLGQDVKLIVVACNSATSVAIQDVIDAVPVPVVGVIEPAVRAAVGATRSGRIGLIGTQATVASGAYQRAVASADGDTELFAAACPRFVEFVEAGDTTSAELLDAATAYLGPLRDAGVDTLILGCTHYPFLRGAIHHVMGDGVLILSSAEATADDVYETLSRQRLLAEGGERAPGHRFESTGDPERFAALGTRFLGPEVRAVRHVPPAELSGDHVRATAAGGGPARAR